MRNWIFITTIVLSISLSSCIKGTESVCTSTTPTFTAAASETAYLQNYITTNNITATAINGMFYSIGTQGTGTSPGACSTLSVFYTGKFITGTTDGAVFDSNTSNASPANLDLYRLITGWRIAMPVLKTGGSITLYIPPSLGYGSNDVKDGNGVVIIPGNSYLKFTINLIAIQ